MYDKVFRRYFWIVGLAVIVFFILVFWQLKKPGFEKSDANSLSAQAQKFYIVEVVDGDTAMIRGNVLVRLIGIDAPEKDEPCFKESKEKLEKLILNQYVFLARDKSYKDDYGRLLRYIFLNNENVNLKMVADGYAVAMPIKPDLKYAKQIKEAEDKAKAERRGCLYGKE